MKVAAQHEVMFVFHIWDAPAVEMEVPQTPEVYIYSTEGEACLLTSPAVNHVLSHILLSSFDITSSFLCQGT